MAQIEKLLNMGMGQGADFERILLGAGSTVAGSERIDWRDVRCAIARTPKHLRAILQLKACPPLVESRELALLMHALWMELQAFEGISVTKRPTTSGHRRIYTPMERSQHRAALRAWGRQARVVSAAIQEYCDPRTCRGCYQSKTPGVVQVNVPGEGLKDQTCEVCDGRGWVPWSDNRRSRAVGGKREDYADRVAPGYLHVLGLCSEWYVEAHKAFMGALFADEVRAAA